MSQSIGKDEMDFNYQHILGAEPRFRIIQHELESLLRLVDLESHGQVVPATGFRLRQLDQWRSAGVDTPLDALGALSGVCNCRCVFCFEREHPFPQDRSRLSMEEASTRLRYYEAETGRALFPSNRVYKETFLNPQALSILKMARHHSAGHIFWLTSNGAFLSEETVRQLEELKPVIIKLSLNSADPRMRGQLMGPANRADAALQAPALLRRFNIPFIGSVVAWPSVLSDDLTRTLHFLDQFEPYGLRVRLPLYHKYLHPARPFSDRFWNKVIGVCRKLRPGLSSPLYVEPSLFWINPIIPEIDGVIRGSPAASANLHVGDRILEIDGKPVYTRCQALGLLAELHRQKRPFVELEIQHLGEKDSGKVILMEKAADYPYNPDVFSPGERYGLLFLDDFRIQYVEQIRNLMMEHDSYSAMVFSSPVVAPIARLLIESLPPYKSFFQERSLSIQVVEESEMGGNYHLMDGRLVADLTRQIERAREQSGDLPDLILIPNAFGNPWGIDYFRKSYKEIERHYGVPVELIDWPILYGRDV